MRRSKVNSASLASASASASIASHTHSTLCHRAEITLCPARHCQGRPQYKARHRHGSVTVTNTNTNNNPTRLSLKLIGLVALLAQVDCVVLGTTTSSATTSTIVNNNTENNFYFDERNQTSTATATATTGTKAISFIGAGDANTTPYVAAPSSPYASASASMSLETTTGLIGGITTGRPMKSATIKTNHTDLLSSSSSSLTSSLSSSSSTTTTRTTTKSARSTLKQSSSDAPRSRNHWSYGGGGGSNPDAERTRTFRSKFHHENHYGPFFEEPSNQIDPGKTLVSSVHLFTEAVLNCRVGMLKDKTVMWVRRTAEKVSLLTVGNVTYSGDPRIRVKFQYPNNWRLLINPTQREDEGSYMCQVSTHPPRVFTTNLTILEPPLRIIDEHERDVGDRYYKSGSTVDLQCQISRNFFQKERYNIFKSTDLTKLNNLNSNDTGHETNLNHNLNLNLNLIGDANQTQATFTSQELEKYFTNFITWAKDEEPLPAQTNRRSSVSDMWLTSRISIAEAKLSDSGNYSCSLGRLFTVIVQVQVLTGELPAAVQHNSAVTVSFCWTLFIVGIWLNLRRCPYINIQLVLSA